MTRARKRFTLTLLREGQTEALGLSLQLRLATARATYLHEARAAHLDYARLDRYAGNRTGMLRHLALARQFHEEARTAQRQSYMLSHRLRELQTTGPARAPRERTFSGNGDGG